MSVFQKVVAWLQSAGLADGYKVQSLRWVEQKNDGRAMKYIVIQPDGGTPRYHCLGAHDFVRVTLIGGKSDKVDDLELIERAQLIMDYVTNSPDDDNLNFIANTGGDCARTYPSTPLCDARTPNPY